MAFAARAVVRYRICSTSAFRSFSHPQCGTRRWLLSSGSGAVREAYQTLRALDGEGSVSLDVSTHAAAGVAIIRVSQPQHRNALTPAIMCGLADAVNGLESFDGRACLLTGDGGFFCAGFDLRFSAMLVPEVGAAINTLMADTTMRLFHSRLVTAAVVERFAIGAGAELATAADFRLMVGPEAFIQVRVFACGC